MTEWYEEDDFPLTPEKAGMKIVAMFLSDLTSDRQKIVAAAIELWDDEWGAAVSSVALESSYR